MQWISLRQKVRQRFAGRIVQVELACIRRSVGCVVPLQRLHNGGAARIKRSLFGVALRKRNDDFVVFHVAKPHNGHVMQANAVGGAANATLVRGLLKLQIDQRAALSLTPSGR